MDFDSWLKSREKTKDCGHWQGNLTRALGSGCDEIIVGPKKSLVAFLVTGLLTLGFKVRMFCGPVNKHSTTIQWGLEP